MPILGYADLLLTVPGRLDDQMETRRVLQTICTAARDAANVVRRLGEFHRQRGGSESRSAVELAQVVLDAMGLSQPRWKDQALANGRTIESDLQMHGEQWVLGNASELRQMLLNLLLNAVDAMPAGGTISIQTRHDGNHIVLQVSDTGVGMTDEVRRRCFDPFFTTKAERGSGLGLATVYGIV